MKKNNKKIGTVISNKKYYEGTISVAMVTTKIHPLYKKVVKSTKKYMVHWPEKKFLEIGTKVSFEKCSRFSKMKNFIITEVKNGL